MTLSVSGDSITFPDLSTLQTAPSGFGFKNRIINGGMTVDQRNAGASFTITGGGASGYGADRFRVFSATNACAIQQSTTAPTGFINSNLFTQSGTGAVAAGDIGLITQRIEGYNIADLGWGTATAKTITISFWVRSSLTGTFGFTLLNGAQNRRFTTSYTISSVNTFEYKTITIPGDTSGTWATDNGVGVGLYWDVGSGTTYSSAAGSVWGTGTTYGLTGGTKVCATTGATFFLTGVQLEKGSTATTFDYRDYGRELIMCQRYFEYRTGQIAATYTNVAGTHIRSTQIVFSVEKRTAPTVAFIGTSEYIAGGAGGVDFTPSTIYLNKSGFSVYAAINISPGLLALGYTGTRAGVTASAEL